MPARSTQGIGGQEVGGLKVCPSDPALSRKTLPTHKRVAYREKDLEAALSSAMLAADKELGNIVREVDRISEALKSDSADNPAAMRIAVHPAVWSAVKHVLVERELRHLALTDDLTCLYNRRGFFAAATHQLRLARRNRHSLLLLFCEVDRLKEIHNTFGHREGDLALVRVADALERAFRESDILARLAGDEFVILAPEASDQGLDAMFGRLRKSLEEINLSESRYQLSVSVGAARFDPRCPVTLGELMAAAERAMYEPKRAVPKLVVHQK